MPQGSSIDRASLEAFLDPARWSALAESKLAYWVDRMSRLGPREGLRVADGLRQAALRLKPGWPSEAEREADLRVHERVSRSLGRVPPGYR